MKPNDIQRSVQTQKYHRTEGDAPSMGRVSRIPGTGLPKSSCGKQKKHESFGNRRSRLARKKVALAWSVLFGLLSLCVIAITLFFRLQSSRHDVEVETEVKAEGAQPAVPANSKFESPSESAALMLVKQAILARDQTSVSKYYRLGSCSPESVVSFLEGMAKLDGPITGYTWLSSVDRNGLLVDGVVVHENSERRIKNRIALLTPNEKGDWQIDFEAFARISKPPFSELSEGKHEGGTVRVFIGKDKYYNGTFIDDSKWTCYKLVSPDSDKSLLGYCVKNSAQDRAMIRIIENSAAVNTMKVPARATLEITRIANAESKQVEISQVLAEDWVLSATSFDSHFQ